MSRTLRRPIAAAIALSIVAFAATAPATAGETKITKPQGNGFIIFSGFGDNGR